MNVESGCRLVTLSTVVEGFSRVIGVYRFNLTTSFFILYARNKYDPTYPEIEGNLRISRDQDVFLFSFDGGSGRFLVWLGDVRDF